MRRPTFRLTFLGRFTIVTLCVSAFSAVLLTASMEISHRGAIENDIEVAAISRLSAELTAPLDKLSATGTLTAALRGEFARIADDAKLFEYVDDIRIYRASGLPVYPLDAPVDVDAVHRALASDSFVRTTHAGTITAYSPYFTSGEQVYVLALDFAPGQFDAAAGREFTQVLSVVAVVTAISFLSLVTLAVGASRELERRRREAQATFASTLTIMADAIDLRDPYTAGHSQRVGAYAKALAIALGLNQRDVDVIESGALLHDIGKIGIRDSVLLKPGPLDPDERALITTHPSIGAKLLGGISAMHDVVPCVLHHHERIDGSGYPEKLSGDAIPLGARVIAVADTFDAMTTDRPYRAGLSPETAVRELRRVAGKQLDARLVRVFVDLVLAGTIAPPVPSARVAPPPNVAPVAIAEVRV